jgi:hypothetical protein
MRRPLWILGGRVATNVRFAVRLALIRLGTVTAEPRWRGRLYLLAHLLGGVELVPFAVATYVRMLPSSPWSDGDGGSGGGPGAGPEDPRGSAPMTRPEPM